MSIETMCDVALGAICLWVGFTSGIGVSTGDWSLTFYALGGVCFGRGLALWQRAKRSRQRSEV